MYNGTTGKLISDGGAVPVIDTAGQILTKLLTVDGAGSGLDADLLDGLSSAAFAAVSHTHAAADITSGVIAIARLATGTPNGSKFIRDDGTLQAISGGGDALVANPLSQFAATTSAQLRGVLSDESGTGAAYFQGGDLGTPSAGVATNLTGTAASLTAGTASVAPAGALSGATLAANVLASSLTSVGTLTGGSTGAGFTIALTTSTLTGTVPTPRLGTGTANSSSYLRGDQTWASVSGSGDVVGPASSTDNSIPRYDSTTGKLLQGSGVIVDDSNNMTGIGDMTATTLAVTTFTLANAGTGAFTVAQAVNGTMTANRILTWNLNDAARTISLTGNLTVPSAATVSGTNTGDQTTIAALTTARTIGGSSFDGSANVTSFPAPGAIGGTTPAAGTFTTVVAGSTTSLLLGTAGSAVGNIGFRNATSGTATVAPPTGALGTYSVTLPNAASTLPIYPQQITYTGPTAARTITLPDAAFTVARSDAAQTFTGVQTFVAPILGTPTSGNLSNCTTDGTNAPGFREIPQNSQSAAYTAVLADSGKHIYHPGADTTARTWTIPANGSVAYLVGTAITFVNDTSGGVITIAITTDTLVLAGAGTTGSRTLAANGVATAIKMTSTRWIISGTGLT